MSKPCVLHGFICGYNAIESKDFPCICKEKGECLCLVSEACLDTQEPSLGCCCATNKDNKECCKLAIPCCAFGIKRPERLCARATWFLCCKSAIAFPFDDDYVASPVCAVLGLQCAPKCTFCSPNGAECPVLNRPLKVYRRAPTAQVIAREQINTPLLVICEQ